MGALKQGIKSFIFKEDTYIKSIAGPYRGIYFYHGPQMKKRTVVYYKAWEKHVVKWMQQYIQPGCSIMIIGAHIGIHALYVAKLTGKAGKVVAFEPWPENYSLLQQNAVKNDFTQLKAECLALSDAPGTTKLYQGFTDGTHSLDKEWIGTENAKSIEVDISTVDLYCGKHDLKPQLILIDVEGHDLQVLLGAKETINKLQPTLIVEHHEDRKQGSKQGIMDFFTTNNYTWVEHERHFLASPAKG